MNRPELTRVYVDFNTMSRDLPGGGHRVRIHETKFRPDFRPGMRLIIYDETLEVEATLELDPVYTGSRVAADHPDHDWWARPDWATRRDLPWPRPEA